MLKSLSPIVVGVSLTLCVASAQAERTLVHEADIPAPVAEVWQAFTTAEGFMSWAVPKAEVDFRVGGAMRTSYNPESNLDDEHTIVNRILAYEPEHMLATLLGRYELLHPIGEQKETHLVVILDRAEGDDGADFGCDFLLELHLRAEPLRSRHIHDEHQRLLALLFEYLHVRLAGSGGDVPVYAPNVVANLVRTYFCELHAAAFERRMILAPEYVIDQTLRAYLEMSDLLEELAGDHVGGESDGRALPVYVTPRRVIP